MHSRRRADSQVRHQAPSTRDQAHLYKQTPLCTVVLADSRKHMRKTNAACAEHQRPGPPLEADTSLHGRVGSHAERDVQDNRGLHPHPRPPYNARALPHGPRGVNSAPVFAEVAETLRGFAYAGRAYPPCKILISTGPPKLRASKTARRSKESARSWLLYRYTTPRANSAVLLNRPKDIFQVN